MCDKLSVELLVILRFPDIKTAGGLTGLWRDEEVKRGQ